MLSDDNRGRLAPEEITYYRRVLVVHGNDPKTGVCLACKVAGCRDFRAAYDTLALAGQVMATPEQWEARG